MSEVWTNSVAFTYEVYDNARQNTGTSVPVGFRTTPFSPGFSTVFGEGPTTMDLFAQQYVSMTVTMICFNANHNNASNLRKTTGTEGAT
jgi:2,4-dienoyl-CoA reductase-like NADH-dependent reductase (Old Yellow Enzyme family)